MKAIISGVIGGVLTALALWLTGLVTPQLIMPDGAILAMNGECPKGWNSYDAAKGKFLIGANGDNFKSGMLGGSEFLVMKKVSEVREFGNGETMYTFKTEDIDGEITGSTDLVQFPWKPSFVGVNFCQK